MDLVALQRYFRKNVKPNVLDWDEKGYFPQGVFEELFRLGLMTAAYPRSCGGTENTTEMLLEVARELGYFSPGIFSSWVANIFAQTAIAQNAPSHLMEELARDQIKGMSLLSLAANESGAGSDLRTIQTRAVRVPGGFRISGAKHFITNANHASHFLVLVETRGESSPELTFVLIPSNSEGISIERPIEKLGQGESNTSNLEFENVFVPERAVLGACGSGLDILARAISRSKTLISGAAVGVARRAHEEVVQYLSMTERSGKSLLSRKDLQTVLVNHHVQMNAGWGLAREAALAWDRNGVAVLEASMAKLFCADMAVSVVDDSIEMLGARGYLRDGILAKLYRDVKLFEIYEGASSIQVALIAREMISKLQSPLEMKRRSAA